MKTRIASLAAAAALTVSAVAVTAAPASADMVPGSTTQFYAYCSVDILGVPVACTQTDLAHSSHVCQYVVTSLGVGLACVQRST
ncbi:hypothetical protein [Amycolatopsis vancoresmycina]|uniref:Secreted protein n=1 Tax=Amycolatopsis vancoresmycina DSM 44592 TaxID=1292037 RepID=R1IC44_9PSEU|nr:hypothetical protein [Amycolatopsis vancoresmycina]EOD70096.1 hypothetical protein H480_02626 [Amycolatopsis vancoresmycina DSM 44592]